MDQVKEWLAKLNLSQYNQNFEDEGQKTPTVMLRQLVRGGCRL